MFDIGFWEFTLIGVITLIVVGPERMPAIAKTVGKYVAKAKRFVAKVQADIDDQIDTTQIKKHLGDMDKDAKILEVLDEVKEDIKDIKKDAQKP